MAARLSRWIAAAVIVAMTGCGGRHAETSSAPESVPLPTAGLAGQAVTIYPLTLLAAEESLGWRDALTPHETALRTADSLIGAYLTERNPEVQWVLPDALRRARRQAPSLLPDPDHLGTAILRSRDLTRVPDPLWSQLRALTGVAGDRYAAVPAALAFFRASDDLGRAELAFVLVDVRTGVVGWRTVAKGEGADPWAALRSALATFSPDLP